MTDTIIGSEKSNQSNPKDELPIFNSEAASSLTGIHVQANANIDDLLFSATCMNESAIEQIRALAIDYSMGSPSIPEKSVGCILFGALYLMEMSNSVVEAASKLTHSEPKPISKEAAQ
jgi:hypothetical protein